MTFNLYKFMLNPFVLLFIAIFTGMLIGKIKFGKFSFGISGTLFSGLIFGWLVTRFANSFQSGDKLFEYSQNLLSRNIIAQDFLYLFLILFIASVGLLASRNIGAILKKYGVKFVFLGLIITFVGAITTFGLTILTTRVFKNEINSYQVSGVYTGALTSSPGLAAATEAAVNHARESVAKYSKSSMKKKQKILDILNKKVTAQNTKSLTGQQKKVFIKNAEAGIGIGYAISYPFGVLIVILAVNFLPKIFQINIAKEKQLFDQEMHSLSNDTSQTAHRESNFDITGFIIVMLTGYSIGKIGISMNFLGIDQSFSLGATGGVLISSLILGHHRKIGPVNFRMDPEILGVIRKISLTFFLAIIGLRYGFDVFQAVASAGTILAGIGIIVGSMAILSGFLIGRYIFRINWIMLAGAICGGMTSTPGLGAAIEALNSNDPAAGYGATYPFALMGVVIFTIIMHLLPI